MFDRAKSPEERRKLKGDQLRVSDADRADAIRRLRAHESMGHLESKEASDRIEAVEASTTPEEIAKLFVELPALTTRPPSIERRSSTQDRQDAILLLEKAYSEGRIEAQECAVAKDRVHVARTRSEIDAAFTVSQRRPESPWGKRHRARRSGLLSSVQACSPRAGAALERRFGTGWSAADCIG